jgi:4-alpha-glucanotransferase
VSARHREVVAPTFSLRERASGILLHLTSLHGPYGNGDLGIEARTFVAFLVAAGQRWWQMLPVNPVGAGYSPYSGVSAFAGNPLLIDLRALIDDDLVTDDELPRPFVDAGIDYASSAAVRSDVLRRAFARFRSTRHPALTAELVAFRNRAAFWLDDYALFMSLKGEYDGAPWTDFPAPLARHLPEAIAEARHRHAEEIAYFVFEQFVFDRQWRALRAFAAERDVGLIGDAPIFVAHDSADVWGNQDSFRLDANGHPTHVSGVPPDYFSKTGQRWGTPLYRWKALARKSFRFWIERFRTLMERFDVIRLDHFIGFARYWEIPVEQETAEHGRWVKGPGSALFEAAERALGTLPFIAEDLGSITPTVVKLRKRHRMPGMNVLQFGFSGDPRDNPFLPHRYLRRSVAYTGTHDNDTTVGWFEDPGALDGPRSPEQAAHERAAALRYLAGPLTHEPEEIHWLMIRAVLASVADTAILPMQDVLGLGTAARMNVPGVSTGNWTFRITAKELDPALAKALRAFSEVYGRLPSGR